MGGVGATEDAGGEMVSLQNDEGRSSPRRGECHESQYWVWVLVGFVGSLAFWVSYGISLVSG